MHCMKLLQSEYITAKYERRVSDVNYAGGYTLGKG